MTFSKSMAACQIVLDRYSILRAPVFILLDVRRKLELMSRGFIARKITEIIIISEGFGLICTSIHLVLLC